MAAITYAFLIDENAMHLKQFFPSGRAKTVKAFGKLSASDSEVLRLADAQRRILVTSNRDDFKELYVAHARQGGKNTCTDLHGLVLFNGERKSQLRFSSFKDLETKMRLREGGVSRRVTWREVFELNLVVRITSKTVTVERLPRCPECVRMEPER